jgi:hypothetical protein
MRRLIHILLIGLVVLGITAAARVRSSTPPRLTEADLVRQPETWVPFQGKLIKESTDRATVYGRYYRASDGSDRVDTGFSLDHIGVISIHHVPSSTYYRYTKAEGWVAGPMLLPSRGWRPLKIAKNMNGLVKYPHKLALAEGQSRSLTATEGFDAYVYSNNVGDVFYEVPELNMFHILRVSTSTGKREVHFDIRLGEPPAELFLPPADAVVTRTEKPDGILWSDKPEFPDHLKVRRGPLGLVDDHQDK